ncbi:hypothetical protein ACWFPY_21900 [Nocardia fluminea]
MVVELGGRSFADDSRRRIATAIVLSLGAAAFSMANVRDACGCGARVVYILGAITATALVLLIAASVTEIDGPRQGLQASAITRRSGYTFLAGRYLLDSGDRFQNKPVIVGRARRDGHSLRPVVMAAARKNRGMGC